MAGKTRAVRARRGDQARAVAQERLQQAIAAHRSGDLDTAERLYLRVLVAQAGQPDALHFLGVLRHQRGRSDEAVALIGRALAQLPQHPDAHNNLGNVHKECGRVAEAEACYRRALACAPDHYLAIGNLAVVLEAQRRLEDAFKAYGLLMQVAPRYAHGHYLLGLFLRNHAQHEQHARQAAECFRAAHRLAPDNLRALEALGVALYSLGEHAEAGEVYREWLECEPGNPVPRHMLAACGRAEAPPRASDDYVREVFDGFAASFDEQLVTHLDYRAPQLLADALRPMMAPAGDREILDAGCGTGLCAPLLRPWARRLRGVDLSPGMLEQARRRGGYDELVEAELTGYLEAHPRTCDAIVSADTLVYFGDLTRVAAAAADALRPGGLFAFTVEALDGDGDRVELGPSGRYRHSRAHVGDALAAAGFVRTRIERDALRNEGGRPVPGWVVVAQAR